MTTRGRTPSPRKGLGMRSLIAGAIILLMIVSVALAVRGGSQAAGADPTNPEQIALGRQVYEGYCAGCHGANLEGQPNWQEAGANGRRPAPPHDETGHTWHHPDQLLFKIVKDGGEAFGPAGYETDMPAFRAILNDEEIWAVLAYIKSRWPEDIRRAHNEINRQAQ
ncbi:MAG: cytochrome c [Herpetosiphonaceae bacterium]|nr:MAG: cytochrome c [Herpetosiphonaceae bacterium]